MMQEYLQKEEDFRDKVLLNQNQQMEQIQQLDPIRSGLSSPRSIGTARRLVYSLLFG